MPSLTPKYFLLFFICFLMLPETLSAQDSNHPLLGSIPGFMDDNRSAPAILDELGDWRPVLSRNGVILSMDTVAGYQDVFSGGINEDGEAGGSVDIELGLDFEKIGLWKGGYLRLFWESRFGDFINANTGSLHAENTDGLYPLPHENEAALTSAAYYHKLSQKAGIFLGKLETLGRDANRFAGGRGKTHFTNQNLVFNPVTLQTIPYSALGGGFYLKDSEDTAAFSLTLLDPNGKPTRAGFDDAFDDGLTLMMEYRLSFKGPGRESHQLLGLAVGTKDYGLAVPDTWLKFSHIPIEPSLERPKKAETWCVYFNYDQFRYFDETDPTSGFGYFLRLGYSDEATNPFEWFYSFGLSLKGLMPQRPDDVLGLGYYFTAISDNLPDYLFILDDEQGMEIYYNFEITPWFHITPNFQIVDTANQFVDTALVAGIRARLNL